MQVRGVLAALVVVGVLVAGTGESGAQDVGPATAPASGPAPSQAPTASPLAPSVQAPNIIGAPSGAEALSIESLSPEARVPSSDLTPAEAAAARATVGAMGARNEFQIFVQRALGHDLPLFGANLFEAPRSFTPLDRVPVPADYVIGPGDELHIRAWGQIDIDLRVVVDRDGRIHIPKVGNITVIGAKFENIDGLIRTAVSRIFRNFELAVTMGQLRSIQIFVVGQAKRPGAYTVSSLSTLVNALFETGGPSPKGSMRRIQLKRGDQVVTEFDVYRLLLLGDKSKDVRLLPGDVIFIPPAGHLVAVSGSVNTPAIYELLGRQSLDNLLRMAGGLSTVASGQKVFLERIDNRQSRRADEVPLTGEGLATLMKDGDLVRVLSLSPRFDNAVTLQGNVATPARYPWRENMRVTDLLVDKNALITSAYWERQNFGQVISRPTRREVNWDFAVVQRLDPHDLTSRLYPFSLGKAIAGDLNENIALQAGDIVIVYAFDETLPRTDRDVSLRGTVLGDHTFRFAWRDGMRIRDLIPDAKWLVERYDYWLNLTGSGLKSEINWEYANLIRRQPEDLTKNVIPFNLGKAVYEADLEHNLALSPGDQIQLFTKEDLNVPQGAQANYVRIEGEFASAGTYRAQPGETLRQLVMRVGGLTPQAYLYGAQFTRDSTRVHQQQQLDAAIARMEAEAERAALQRAQGVLSREDSEALEAQSSAQRRLIAQLREVRATGRIVLDIPPTRAAIKHLPDIPLEDGDRLFVPPVPGTVNVFGSVFNQNAYLYRSRARARDYLDQAGGPTRDADRKSIYVVRADGSVISQQQSGWFGGNVRNERLMPGDTIVVPEDFDKFSLTKELKDWSQIFYQFALGVAAIKVLRDL